MATTKAKHGGKRAGAGRPKGTLTAPERERIAVEVETWIAAALDEEAAKLGWKRTLYLRNLLTNTARNCIERKRR